MTTETPGSNRSNVISVVLIVPDARRRRGLAAAITGPRAAIVREFGEYELAELDCDVVVVDLDADIGRAIGLIGDICSFYPAVTVMALSSQNDSGLLRRSMQAGAREFLIEPLLPETVAEALTRALARRPHQEKAMGKTLVFVPTKGGVGVTTLAANFAVVLARESGARVVVVDLDLQLGQIMLGLGMSAAHSVADALTHVDRLDRDFLSTLLTRHSSGLAVLGSPEEYGCCQNFTAEGASKLFRILREEFDYVVVDSGTYHGQLQESVFELADTLYLVTELTLPALRNAHHVIAHLSVGDEGRRPMEVVVNRFDSKHGDIGETTATKAMGRPVNWRIPNGYAAARAAQANGVPLAMENSPITKALVQMAKAASGQPSGGTKPSGKGFSFFGLRGVTDTWGSGAVLLKKEI